VLALSENLREVTQRVHGRWFRKIELLTDSAEHVRDWREGMLEGSVPNFLTGLAAGAFTHSGLTAFTASLVANGVLDNAWHVDSAVAGAWLQVDLGVGVAKAFQWLRLRTAVVTGMPNATWDVEYSDNASTWTVAYAGLVVGPGGVQNFNWFAVAWPFAGAHRYWRILLKNAPGSGPWYQELAMAETFEFDATGAVRLASSALQDIAFAAGTAKFTGLLDDLTTNVQRILLFELDAARNPLTVTKATLRLNRNATGTGPLFDGVFVLHAFVVDQNGLASLGTVPQITTNGWNLRPAASPVEVLASSVSWSADEAEVDFVFPAPGIEVGQVRQGTDRPAGKWHLAFVLTLVRGTNTNAAWIHDMAQTDGEETTAGKGTLSWWDMRRAVFAVVIPNYRTIAVPGQEKPSAGGWFQAAKSVSLGRAALHVRTNTGASGVLTFDTSTLNDADFDLGAAPTGDVEFAGKGETPLGTTLTFEVWNGSAWVTYKDGDRATVELPTVPKQQTYQMRATLGGSADNLRTPILRAVGVRDVVAEDLSNIVEPPDTFYQVIDIVGCRSEVAELRLRIIRHGHSGDAEDVISRLITGTANVTAMHVRISTAAPGLARADELHIDTYRVDDYLASEAAIDLYCVSALDRLKLPIPKRKLVSGNWVVDPAKYDAAAGHTLPSVFEDVRDGQLGLAGRYAGSIPQGGPIDRAGVQWSKIQGQIGAPGVGTAGKTELTKDVLEQLSRIAGGVLTTIQGKIHHRDLFGQKTVVAHFPETEITWDATPPGLRQRAPRVLVSFQPATLGGKDWTKSIEREDATILGAIEQAGTEAGTQVDEFPETVSRWIRVSNPTSLTDSVIDDAEGMADALAHRHVRTFGAGLLVWPFTARVPHPHLEIGDMVSAENSKFVGRDPASGRELRGPLQVRAVIVGRNLWGTRFLVWVRAYSDMVTSSLSVGQRGTFEPLVTMVVEDVDGRPDQARVRIRANPDNASEVTIRYAVVAEFAAMPERSTDAVVWTTYAAPVVVNRNAALVQRFVAWADWLGAWGPRTVVEIAPDRRPQILAMTFANAHVDVAHQDVAHQDVAHGDAAHADSHGDSAHQDAHGDAHDDSPTLYFSETGQCIALAGTEVCQPHGDHDDFVHSDVAHSDSHSDTAHSDSAHSDAHTDGVHGDGNYGVGVAVQADGDTGSVKVVARKTADPTAADVRTQPYTDGRNVVVSLIDAATGLQLVLNPGDTAFIAGLAYSRAAAAGLEGPLALARASRFTVAPVGIDLWVPA
jgi:hypothetical protein